MVWLPEVAGEVGLGASAVGIIKSEVAVGRAEVVVVLVTLVDGTTGGAAMVVASIATARAVNKVQDESLTIFLAFLFCCVKCWCEGGDILLGIAPSN